jgi:hypothetical protein
MKEHEGGDKDEEPYVSGHEVVEACESDFLVPVVPDHEKPSGNGRDLLSEEEDESVLRCVDEDEGDGDHAE